MTTAVMPRSNHLRPLALALTAFLAAGLGAAPAVGQQAGPQAESPGGVIDRVLVRVGDRAILHSEFQARLQDMLNVTAAQMPQEQIDAQMPLLRMDTVVGMVTEAILEMKAEEIGITANPNEIDRAIANLRERSNLLEDAQWSQALAQSGMSEAQLRETIAGNIVQQRMMQQEIARQVFVSNREAAAYYESHTQDFVEPEQVLYQQIIFVYQGADRAPVRERAESALAELRGGSSLTTVANKYARPQQDSVQPASEASWVSPGDIQPEVRAVVEGLTPLAYSDVIEGRFGYHIVQLMDRKEGRTVPFEEVSGYIRNLLSEQKAGVALNEYVAELVDAFSLEIYAEEFADLPEALSQELQGEPTGPPRQR